MRHRLVRATRCTLGFSLTQSCFVEAVAAGLPSERQRNSLRVRVGAKLKMVAWGAVPDQLLDACLDAALKEIASIAA
jgi:hypothetical protein